MDSSEASKNKKEDTSSSSSQPPPPPESSYLSYLDSLSPIKQPVNTYDHEDHFLLGELDSSRFVFTPPRLSLSPATQLFESDITGGERLIEDPHNTKKFSLLSEEPKTGHQEKPAYVDEPGKIQNVEWPSPEPLHDVKEYEDYGEMEPTLHVGAENLWRDGSEASQNLRDLRRCIQYKEAASNALGSNISPLPAHIIPETSESSAPNTVTVYKPSGLLHLNSLIKATPPSATTGMGSAEGSESKRMKYRFVISPDMDWNTTVRFSTINENPEIDASVAADVVTSDFESLSFVEPFTSSSYAATASIHDNKKISPTDHAGNSEEFNQPRPSKKRRTNTTDTDDDFKRCTCKRSACVKLYCECFAAELYCGEPCSCLGCINRPEYRDKVLDIRQEIKSRNPFAFAPKIVQNVTDIPSKDTEDDNLNTPSSARHKRGCNCRKSKCLKNYCECFEFKVGCSSWCRCQGCENPYGKKELGENQQDNVAVEEDALSKERESVRVEQVSDLLHAELDDNDVHRLTPLTPSLQCSDMRQSSVSLTNVSQVTPLTIIPASMSGASTWDWTHTPRGRSISLFGGPLRPLSSPMPITPMTRLGETTNLQRLESSSSGGLIKDREYILKSVPSFPPLTPCIDPKAKGNGDEEDSGDAARELDKRL